MFIMNSYSRNWKGIFVSEYKYFTCILFLLPVYCRLARRWCCLKLKWAQRKFSPYDWHFNFPHFEPRQWR